MPQGPHQADGRPPTFREAIAQWRLAVRTEVKAASSLPTAMFDTGDPMLEMQLAETTEALLAQLQMPPDAVVQGDATAIQRLEHIAADELRELPTRIGTDHGVEVDVLSNLAGEYLGILADCCCTQQGLAQQRAAEHVCRDFGVTPDDLDEVVAELRRLAASEADATTDFEHVIAQVAATVRRLAPPAEAKPR